MQTFRADRPNEWQMDEFIGMAEKMHEMNKELLAALEAFRAEVPDDRHAELAGCDPYSISRETLNVIDSAIAKAKGTS